jgi:hypothetical protein
MAFDSDSILDYEGGFLGVGGCIDGHLHLKHYFEGVLTRNEKINGTVLYDYDMLMEL